MNVLMKVGIFLLMMTGMSFTSICLNPIFEQGTAALRQKNYQQALDLFKNAEQHDIAGFGLFKNIGLCYAGLNQYAEAILYFEKALKICPYDQNVAKDLAIIRKKNTAMTDQLPPVFPIRVINSVFGIFHADTWGYLTLILAVLMGILLVNMYPFTTITKKDYYFIGSLFLLISFTITAGLIRYKQIYHNNGIIITSPEVYLKLGPDADSPDVMALPAGTKVYYQEFLGTWWHVTTDYGDTGWIEATKAKRI